MHIFFPLRGLLFYSFSLSCFWYFSWIIFTFPFCSCIFHCFFLFYRASSSFLYFMLSIHYCLTFWFRLPICITERNLSCFFQWRSVLRCRVRGGICYISRIQYWRRCTHRNTIRNHICSSIFRRRSWKGISSITRTIDGFYRCIG